MAGPLWLRVTLALLMIVIAVGYAVRLCLASAGGSDGVHATMGVAMAGMLVPGISLLPAGVWEAAFTLSAGWFGWLMIRPDVSGASARRDAPFPHLLECVAMVYMFLAAADGFGPPAIAVLLALCMVGAVVWRADGLVRAGAPSSLAPRLTVAGKIAMSATMGYMLFQLV